MDRRIAIGKARHARRISALAVVGIVTSLGLVACGSSGASQEELQQAKRQAANHVHKEVRLRNLEKELRHVKRGGAGTVAVVPSSSSSTSSVSTSSPSNCGEELSVGSATTCPFAENVKEAYFSEIGSGSGTVEAYSPVTGDLYSMYCTASPHECTGGHNASVYFP